MIDAIIPIPCRYPTGYRLGMGFSRGHRPSTGLAATDGRTITVQPLYFYKIFSTWNNATYEHTFLSDELIDPITLGRSVNITNGQKNSVNGGTLVPISVKRSDSAHVTVHLFPMCIDFLFSSYVPGVPIDEASVIDTPSFSHLCDNYIGIVGISEFLFHALGHYLARNNWAGIDPWMQMVLTRMSPEMPEFVTNYVQEIEALHLYDDRLVGYMSDVCTYERNVMFDLREYLIAQAQLTLPLDPITLLCVSTPSYLYGHQLRPFLGDECSLRNYAQLGWSPSDTNRLDGGKPLNLVYETADPYAWSDGLMEKLMAIPDSDISIRLDEQGTLINNQSIITTMGPSVYDDLVNLIRMSCPSKAISLTKNFADEVFIQLADSSVHNFYMHLGWYHLMSPSLINLGRLK